MRLDSVAFASREASPVQLEGLFYAPEGDGLWPAAVVCHPHPLGGGTMRNAVVAAVARSLSAHGVAALRFNFRGVGQSGGAYDRGLREQADVAGALDWLRGHRRVDSGRLFVTGYSFGAWVGLTVAQGEPGVAAVAAVGLVPWHPDLDLLQAAQSRHGSGLGEFEPGFLQAFTRPKLFVAAEHDVFAPPGLLTDLVERLPAPKRLDLIAGADHFFAGHSEHVADLVAHFVASL